jgi:hypothetical protein
MGITSNCAVFLAHVKKRGVDFSSTVMLGRQQLYITSKTLQRLFADVIVDKVASSKYGEPFFNALGGQTVESLDYSDYENADLIYDLNKPLPDSLNNRYTVVFDGGTLEHVFNFPVAIKNCMDMVRVGGHFISITPCNNQCGHGLYQFSPELFYSIFSETHGFMVKVMYLAVDITDDEREWYEVANPQIVKSRVVFKNSSPTYLMVVARKEFDFKGELNPYQSDYNEIWTTKKEEGAPSGVLVKFYKVFVPAFIRERVYKIRHRRRKTSTKGLANVDADHFKPVKID